MEHENQLNHLAIILDGNGRWATEKGLPRIKGHQEGTKKVKEIAIAASQEGIKRLTVYAFSTENWKRPEKEVNFIFKLPKEFLKRYLKDLMKHQIKIEYIGDLENIPSSAKKSINDSMTLTQDNKGMVLCFALNYGYYDEMIKAVQKIATKVKNDKLSVDEIDKKVIEDNLMDKTPVDLLIRTGGEQRISNFMMWQIAYSEIYFTKVLWPDFSIEDLGEALANYYQRDRRFGGINNEG
jgi:undecaprenyl diphosphate synthase